ncbi:uncharacterized protein J3D65DRAFT_20784 [Phyllosticta citribraziliensis]|uniref:Secreted protein n=1 Tax=Phyllosticta citribraziliensis TaxID=989973 RepID=A0ABR1M9B6_9PEZI
MHEIHIWAWTQSWRRHAFICFLFSFSCLGPRCAEREQGGWACMLASLPPHALSSHAFERFYSSPNPPRQPTLLDIRYTRPHHHHRNPCNGTGVSEFGSSRQLLAIPCLPALSVFPVDKASRGGFSSFSFPSFLFLCHGVSCWRCCCLLLCVIGLLICGWRRMWAAGQLVGWDGMG